MSANRTAGGIRLPSFEAPAPESGIATGIPSAAAGANAERLASSLARLSSKIGASADRQAREEGGNAGARAAMDMEFRRQEENSEFARAFNRTGELVALSQLEIQARSEIERVHQEHGHDPQAQERAFQGLYEELSSMEVLQESPALMAQFQGVFDRSTLAYSRTTARRITATAEASQRAAVQDWSALRLSELDRIAREAGLDPAADAALTAEISDLAAGLAAYGPREAFSAGGVEYAADASRPGALTPEQIGSVLRQGGRAVTEGRIMGAFGRIDGLAEQVEFREAFLAEADDPDGAYPDLSRADINDIDAAMWRQISRGQTAARQELAAQERAIQRALGDALEVTGEGLPAGVGVFEEIAARAARIGAEDLALEAQEAGNLAQLADWAWRQAPAELEAVARERRAELHARGAASAYQAREVEVLERVSGQLQSGLINDPLSTAVRAGVADVPPLAMHNDDGQADPSVFAQSLAARAGTARAVAEHYGLAAPRYFTEAESRMLSDAVAAGEVERLAVAGVMVDALGAEAPAALAELSSDDPMLAHMGGLISASAAGAAGDLARGMRLREMEGWESRLPSHNEVLRGGGTISELRSSALGDFGRVLPETAGRISAAADHIYNARATRQGVLGEEFDPALYRRALNEAAGASFMRDARGREVQYGGFTEVRHRGRYMLPVPAWLRADHMTSALNLLHDDEVLATLPDRPRDSHGAAVPGAELSRAWFRPAGNGRYFVGFGRRDAAQPTLALDGNGDPFVLNLADMRARIAADHPDWVRP